jgi:hypothetical protein
MNLEKAKCMLMPCCLKAGQKHSIKIVNRSFPDVAKFVYLGTTLTDQNIWGMLATIWFRAFYHPTCCP